MACVKPATIQGITRRGCRADISLLLLLDCRISSRLPCLHPTVQMMIRPKTTLSMTKRSLLVLVCMHIWWYTQKWLGHASNMYGLLFRPEIRYSAYYASLRQHSKTMVSEELWHHDTVLATRIFHKRKIKETRPASMIKCHLNSAFVGEISLS